jgi:hypothetical protein
MKFLLLILILTVLACSKSNEKTQCYTCQVSGFGGNPGYVTEKCTNKIDTMHFEDQNNNSLSWSCQPK